MSQPGRQADRQTGKSEFHSFTFFGTSFWMDIFTRKFRHYFTVIALARTIILTKWSICDYIHANELKRMSCASDSKMLKNWIDPKLLERTVKKQFCSLKWNQQSMLTKEMKVSSLPCEMMESIHRLHSAAHIMNLPINDQKKQCRWDKQQKEMGKNLTHTRISSFPYTDFHFRLLLLPFISSNHF